MKQSFVRFIKYFSPKKLLLAGLFFSIPGVLLIIRPSGLYSFGVEKLSGKFVELWFLSMYLAGLLPLVWFLWWLGTRKNVFVQWFFRFFVALIIIIMVGLSGLVPVPIYCTQIYLPHGDGFNGTIYFDPECSAGHFPWQVSFWSDMVDGKDISWQRFGILEDYGRGF